MKMAMKDGKIMLIEVDNTQMAIIKSWNSMKYDRRKSMMIGDCSKELLDKLHRDMEGFQDMELTEDSRMTLASGWAGGWRTMVRLPCGPTPCGVMSSSSGATSSPTWGIRSSPG